MTFILQRSVKDEYLYANSKVVTPISIINVTCINNVPLIEGTIPFSFLVQYSPTLELCDHLRDAGILGIKEQANSPFEDMLVRFTLMLIGVPSDKSPPV